MRSLDRIWKSFIISTEFTLLGRKCVTGSVLVYWAQSQACLSASCSGPIILNRVNQGVPKISRMRMHKPMQISQLRCYSNCQDIRNSVANKKKWPIKKYKFYFLWNFFLFSKNLRHFVNIKDMIETFLCLIYAYTQPHYYFISG